MKTAGRENPNRCATGHSNRVHGAAGQTRSRSIEWAAKQEKLRPAEMCFFLTSLYRTYQEFWPTPDNALTGQVRSFAFLFSWRRGALIPLPV